MLVALAPALSSTTTASGVGAVVGLVGVLEREGVDVDDHRGAPGLADHAGVVGNLLVLRGDQQDVHGRLAAGSAGCRGSGSRG